MESEVPSVAALTTFGGAAIVTSLVMEVVKKVWAPKPETLDRFGGLIAIGIGIIVVMVGLFAVGSIDTANVVSGVITGLFAGCSAIGLYTLARKVS